jgi:hypothetical protein
MSIVSEYAAPMGTPVTMCVLERASWASDAPAEFAYWAKKHMQAGHKIMYVPNTVIVRLGGDYIAPIQDDLDAPIRQWLYLDDEYDGYPMQGDCICVRSDLTPDDFDVQIIGDCIP